MNDARKRTFLGLLTMGCSRKSAARSIGATADELRQALATDEKFASEVERAETALEQYCLQRMRESANTDTGWRAAAWLLERRLPERYGKAKPEQITQEAVTKYMQQVFLILEEEITDQELKQRIYNRFGEEVSENE